uniref:Uncharacterized protein n=1 Tax=Rhizophora mucronata TaxID=61149 RepID=A0A2P2R1W0_RHIMU
MSFSSQHFFHFPLPNELMEFMHLF